MAESKIARARFQVLSRTGQKIVTVDVLPILKPANHRDLRKTMIPEIEVPLHIIHNKLCK